MGGLFLSVAGSVESPSAFGRIGRRLTAVAGSEESPSAFG